ncbi:MAG: hypothetical protein NTV86_10635 [Planctomycetota bacterium]|nr:hypothetical protein [Planctomycetota bacterium]
MNMVSGLTMWMMAMACVLWLASPARGFVEVGTGNAGLLGAA